MCDSCVRLCDAGQCIQEILRLPAAANSPTTCAPDSASAACRGFSAHASPGTASSAPAARRSSGSGPRPDMTPAPRPEGLRPAGSRPARTREPRVGDTHPTASLLVGTGHTRVRPCDGHRRTPSRIAPRDRDQTTARRDLSRLNQDGRILARPQLPRPHMKKEHDRALRRGAQVVRPSAIPPVGSKTAAPRLGGPAQGCGGAGGLAVHVRAVWSGTRVTWIPNPAVTW